MSSRVGALDDRDALVLAKIDAGLHDHIDGAKACSMFARI